MKRIAHRATFGSLAIGSLAAAALALSLFTGGSVRAAPKNAIQNRGSDTMIELAQAWAEEYKDAEVEVAGGGSGVGIAALIDGKVDIANASRTMTDKEIETAKQKSGKTPKLHVVGYDALAIYVHKDNPLEEITLDQLKEIYGNGGKISSWSELGVKIPGCQNDKIELVSRQNNSGTYEYFREHVLGKDGKYKLGTIDQSGSKDVVALVGKTPCAIGYSGMGYKTDAVKFLKVKGKEGKAVGPSIEGVYKKTYPISRPLFMYTLGEGSPAAQKYIEWCRSDAAQKILEKIGYVPLQAKERANASS